MKEVCLGYKLVKRGVHQEGLSFIITFCGLTCFGVNINLDVAGRDFRQAQMAACALKGRSLYQNCVAVSVGDASVCNAQYSAYVSCIAVVGSPGENDVWEQDVHDKYFPQPYSPCHFLSSRLIIADICS